jgi:DNA gyrase/topoisomerase IV subunit A
MPVLLNVGLIWSFASGRAYNLPAAGIPCTGGQHKGAKSITKGTALAQLLAVDMEKDPVVTAFPLQPKRDRGIKGPSELLIITKRGWIKKINADMLENITAKGLNLMELAKGDCVISVQQVWNDADEYAAGNTSGFDLLVTTRLGIGRVINTLSLPASSRAAKGKRAIFLQSRDEVVAACILGKPNSNSAEDPELTDSDDDPANVGDYSSVDDSDTGDESADDTDVTVSDDGSISNSSKFALLMTSKGYGQLTQAEEFADSFAHRRRGKMVMKLFGKSPFSIGRLMSADKKDDISANKLSPVKGFLKGVEVCSLADEVSVLFFSGCFSNRSDIFSSSFAPERVS